MVRYTQKQLRNMVAQGIAKELQYSERNNVKETLSQLGYSACVYGCNGALLRGDQSGQLYAIIGRTSALFYWC